MWEETRVFIWMWEGEIPPRYRYKLRMLLLDPLASYPGSHVGGRGYVQPTNSLPLT